MPKATPTPEPGAAGEAAKSTAPEPRNIAVTVLKNRTKIGNAICAAGRCDFPITASEAQTLADLGLVRIEGTF